VSMIVGIRIRHRLGHLLAVGFVSIGPGFNLTETGTSKLHLGFDLGIGFDSNPHSIPYAITPVPGDIVARLRPNVNFLQNNNFYTLRLHGSLDWGFLPGLVNTGTTQFFLYETDIGANLELNKNGTLGFAIGDIFSWQSEPAYLSIGSTYNYLTNRVQAGLSWRPGGGTLVSKLTYYLDFQKWFDFENSLGIIRQGAFDSLSHTLALRMDYRFFPRTTFFTELSGGYHTYPWSPVNPTSFPIGVWAGVYGQFRNKLYGILQLGYQNPLTLDKEKGTSFLSSDELVTSDLVSVVGQAELQYHFLPTAKVAAGFRRSFRPGPLYQYYGDNRFYANYEQLFFNHFLTELQVGDSIIEFGNEQQVDTSGTYITDKIARDRLDNHLNLNLALSYFFQPWMAVGVANIFDWRATNAHDITRGGIDLSSVRNQTMLFLTIRY
jgi:hypothetical protein